MKMTKYTAIAAGLLALVSCEREFVKTQVADESHFVAPVLQPMTDVLVDANNNKVEAVTFVWTPADMGVSTQVEYSLYAKNGEKQALLGSTYSTSLSVSKEDINSLAVGELEIPRNATGAVDAWVEAAITGFNTTVLKSTNTITFNITTFDPPKTWVFFPGYYNSWGDNIDKYAWRVWEVEGGTGIYRTIVQLKEDADNTPGVCPLKLYMDGAWLGGKDGYEATWDNWDYGDKDGNWGVPANEPINIIEFSKSKKQASRTRISHLGVIGDFAPSNWSEDVKFVYDDKKNVWTTPEMTFDADKQFLIRLNGSWDAKFKYGGPLKKTDVLQKEAGIEGDVFELVNSGTADNITIPAAGTYVFTLYANRTPLLLVMEKK